MDNRMESSLFVFTLDPSDPKRVLSNMSALARSRERSAGEPQRPPSSTYEAAQEAQQGSSLKRQLPPSDSEVPQDGSGTKVHRTGLFGAASAALSKGEYTLEYDGAAKGNPGPAGAGALLKDPSGMVIFEQSLGLGKTTNNVAEYRGLIAGMRAALERGVTHLTVKGDSDLVCKQVNGEWKVNKPHLAVLCKEAQRLKQKFAKCKIVHVFRESNAAADNLANRGVGLPEEKFVSEFA